MRCHHPSESLLSQLAFERNTSCPEKLSNRLEPFSTSLFLFLTSLIFFFFFLPAAVVREVIGGSVLGCEIFSACLLWNPKLRLLSMK